MSDVLPCPSLGVFPSLARDNSSLGPSLSVNHYKCPLCDMTCPLPSSLRNHMRFRHSEERPFKCDNCDYRWALPGLREEGEASPCAGCRKESFSGG